MDSFERQQSASARQTVAKSRGGLQKLAPPEQQQQQQVVANNKIDYDGARARNGRELDKTNSTTATTFVIYENLNANSRHRGHRSQEAAPPEQRIRVERSQEHGHLSTALKTKIATSQEQQSKSAAERSRVVLPSLSPSSGQRQEQQVASFECAARQMRGSSLRNSDDHLIRLKLRCQDDQQATTIVIDRQQQQQQQRKEKMKMSSRQKNQVRNSNYAPQSAIKIHNHLMNGAHEPPQPPPLLPPTASSGSPLSPSPQNHNHLLLSTNGGNGQTYSPSSTINNRNTHTLNSHRSTRSTATDSSGFSSEASTTSCRTSSSQNYHHHQQQQQVTTTDSQRASGACAGSNKSAKSHSSLIRSRLIEDLNRLEKIAAAARAQRAGDHHLTNTACSVASTPAATLSRTSHVELDYSTLCRDEFSSFIAYRGAPIDSDGQQVEQAAAGAVAATSVPSQQQQEQVVKKMSEKRHRASKQRSHKSSAAAALGGPMLVGVHECETPRNELTDRVPDLARSVSSSASSRSSSSSNPSSPDQNNLNSACSSSSPIASLSTGGSHDDDDDQEYREQFGSDEDFDDEIRIGQAKASPIDYKNNNHLLSRPTRTHEAHIEEYFSDESDHREQQNHRLYDQQDQDRLSSLEDEDYKLPASSPRPDYKLELNLLPKEGTGDEDKLGEMLDVYLSRVESLLRLAKGDKSIKLNEMSIGELDGSPKAAGDKLSARPAGEIEISEEFKTRIAYVPSPRRVDKLPEVIQEMEILNETNGECEDEDVEEKSFFLTNIVSDNFKALLSSPQTSAKLNWWPNQLEVPPAAAIRTDQLLPVANEHEVNFIDEYRRQVLEQSFLKSWLELSRCDDQQQVGENGQSNKQKHYESLVKTIRRHMGDFVSNYNTYQATMREETSFASDWHANWLFSTTRPSETNNLPLKSSQQQQQVTNKRAKLMSDLGEEQRHYQTSQIKQSSELLNYSTLLLAKYKPIKVAFVDTDEREQEDDSHRREGAKYKRQIDTCYEEQPEQVDELQQTFLALNGQVNVCQLMLSDSFADSDQSLELDDDDEGKQLGGQVGERKPLEVSYETSLRAGRPLVDGQLMSFRAHGHLFELRRLRQFFNSPPAPARSSSSHRQLQTRRKLEALKQLVLARLRRACQHEHGRKLDLVASQLPCRQVQRDQVRFLVHISSLQVSQPLPVIQFCAKITGALPIRVSWHKQLDEGDGCSSPGSYCELTRSRHDDEWPLTMQANYELEYENKWSSWYRFRRRHDELLFEIREPSARHDYDKTYKCVIENYCSIRECEFTLQVVKRARSASSSENTRRLQASAVARSRRLAKSALRREKNAGQEEEEDELGKVRLNRVESGRGESHEAGQAILRTWSQRTLNKRAPLVTNGERHLLEPLVESQQSKQFALGGGGQQSQTVGRLSAQVQDECKFGTNYPYHPVSLMKRLEENKMSLTLGSRLRGLSSGGMPSSEDTDRYYDLTTIEQDEQQLDFMRPPEAAAATGGLQRRDQRQGLEDKDDEQHESTSGQNSPANFRHPPAELELPTPRPRHKPVVAASELRPPLGELIEPKNHREPLEEEIVSSSSSAFANQVARDDCATNQRRPVGGDSDDGENNYWHHGQSTVGRAQVELCQSTPRADNDDQSARRHHLTFERTNARPASGDGEQSRAALVGSGKLADSSRRRPSCDHDERGGDYDDGRLAAAAAASEQQKPAREEIEVVKPKSVRSLISRFNMA